MKFAFLGAFAVSGLAVGVAASQSAGSATLPENASPIYGVTIPEGYRDWKFIAPAQEAPPLDELRAVLGNDIAIEAYKKGTLPFPDGSILVKLAYKRKQSTEFAPATVPGAPTTVQVMVKDSKKYPDSHGWGFGRFVDGKPVDIAQHETCLSCHVGNVRDHDYVFTRYAP
ncbi:MULTISPECIES: cytochrome P460 family protein [Rhizobium]|uniref:Cytochrome P460 n=1 Tax=Rhizobium dioscoreae TaxID=2653122 RepID=A0ABQ0ZAH3_9HYPH|nr:MULTISPECIES: cytochrome P460 family protein [Rhizobium]MCZ3378322.1 cytochrome P460 family protein [Rhizobium sp. AG207R]GES52495.1 cytochrome P460 [Rhizobium dioscoreae]GLU83846.1 cytochrome P460 [Rhizobium sp. NBRC 114257]